MTTAAAPRPRALRSRARQLAEALATPLVPSAYVDLLDPLRTPGRGRVVEVRPETRDAVTLVVRPGRGWTGHLPGQYVRIGVDVDGVRQWRTYSLTSPVDRPDGCFGITVKAVPDGVVSNHLVRRTVPGTLLNLDGVAGDFVLPTPLPRKVLFVTAGSGVTPVMGMLRSHVLDDVVLVHSAPTKDDVVFGGELRALAASGRLRLVERHTDADGMLSAGEVADLVPDLDERETWACGPAGMLDALQEHWDERGRVLHTERFRTSPVVVGDGGTVRFDRSGVVVEADGATPLLQAGEAAGMLMPSGCRMGICFGCVVPLRSGAVRDLRDGALTTAADGDGVLIQTCVSAAAGACDLDL